MFEKYVHHGNKVTVRVGDKGKHREHCLCWDCKHFNPDNRAENCPIANILYNLDKELGLVTPVWECPRFEEA